jgi:predicted RecB family nuclease
VKPKSPAVREPVYLRPDMKILSDRIQISPTDLSNHLGCRHLTEQNRLLALGKIERPSWTDPALRVLAKRGDEHEEAYVSHLRRKGFVVENLEGRSVDATVQAMQRGVDIIVQAPLSDQALSLNEKARHSWMGFADILVKVQTPSSLGDWSYEVQDTKLARDTRAATILQLSLYTDLAGRIQQHMPEYMYVVKPGVQENQEPFEVEKFRFADFQAYYHRAKESLVEILLNEPPVTYPDPVEKCSICRWWKECDKKRHNDDHLSLIASIRSMHVGELARQEITTLEQFAKREYPLMEKPKRGNIESYQKIHSQAKIQFAGRLEKKLLHELLPLEKGRGFFRLPDLSPGDIYFDIEGDPFYEQHGLEYLLGYVYINEENQAVYQKLWAKNRREEKQAFHAFMEFVMARLNKFPDLHVYHFAPYEPAAIKRLSLRHTLHEEDLDWLLRAERFIDLHAVAKEGIRASVERYSLKDLERFTPYVRKVELSAASSARRAVEFALELKDDKSLAPDTLVLVEDYNEDDCRATLALHQWLEGLRKKLVDQGNDVVRPALKTGEATEAVEELDVRAKSIFEGLTAGLSDDPQEWSESDSAKWLLANQIDFFRRENKSAYWEFFHLHELSYDDLMDERKGIAGLEYAGNVPLTGRKKSPVHKYRFPPQEVGLDTGSVLVEVMGQEIGTISAISQESCTVEIKKMEKSKDVHPVCVHERKIVSAKELTNAICDIANCIIQDGMESMPYRAAKDMLMKKSPRLTLPCDGELLHDGEDALEGAVRIASAMKCSVLGIQGPPGSGKTHTGAIMILKLVKQGKRVGVTALSHKVIINLFEKVLELGARNNIPVSLVHRAKDGEILPSGIERAKDNKHALQALDEKKVVGGTAWLWASNDAREALDYLFVDEAGQMSLAHVLAASRSARNIVLLGDPQQLEQPQRAAHPDGADIAALNHLLDGHHTMPDDKGIFLGVTRRLHPRITDFTSEVFYEGRLRPLPGLERQNILGNTPFAGAGLFYVPVLHTGNQNRSDEEVKVISRIVHQLVSSVVTWTNASGKTLPLIKDDILIVAPYNAQVAALSEALPGCRIGTVDKFQGQEAAIVIYSLTSSSPQDAPRGMRFLYSPNRLNVATSRAQCVSILIGSENLFEADCRTTEEMRWANGFCRYRELARTVWI